MTEINEGGKMEREATDGPLPVVKVPVRSCTTELAHVQGSIGPSRCALRIFTGSPHLGD